MQSISQNDINRFKVVTEANDSVAKSYLSRFGDFSAALNAFLKFKAQESSLSDEEFSPSRQDQQSYSRSRLKTSQESTDDADSNKFGVVSGANKRKNNEAMDLETDSVDTKSSQKGKVSASKSAIDAFAYFKNLTQTDDIMDEESTFIKKSGEEISLATPDKTRLQHRNSLEIKKKNEIQQRNEDTNKRSINRQSSNDKREKESESISKKIKDVQPAEKLRQISISQNNNKNQLRKQPRKYEDNDLIDVEEDVIEEVKDTKTSHGYASKSSKNVFKRKSSDFTNDEEFEKTKTPEKLKRKSGSFNKTLEIEDEYEEIVSDKSPTEPEVQPASISFSKEDMSDNDDSDNDNGYDEPEVPNKKQLHRREPPKISGDVKIRKRKGSDEEYVVEEEDYDNQDEDEEDDEYYEEPEEGVRKKVNFSHIIKRHNEKEAIKAEEAKVQNVYEQQMHRPNLPDLPYKIKNSYQDYVKPHIKQTPTKSKGRGKASKKVEEQNGSWPKFLGSLLVECRLIFPEFADRIKVHDTLHMNADPIKFTSTNVKKTQKVKDKEKTVYKKSWTIKGNSLVVRCFWKGQQVGQLKCFNDEIFVFLLTKKYIFIEATVLEIVKGSSNQIIANADPSDPSKPKEDFQRLLANLVPASKLRVQINIFLAQQVVLEPLNIMATPGKKQIKNKRSLPKEDSLEDEEGEDDDSQKMYQILKYTKESLARLFSLLSIKVTLPSVVQVRHRIDPFKRLRKEKYNSDRSSSAGFEESSGAQPGLIMDAIPQYYKRPQMNNNYSQKNSQAPAWAKFQQDVSEFGDYEDEDEFADEIYSEAVSYLDEEYEDEDDERYRRTQNRSGKSSGSKISEPGSEKKTPIRDAEEEKANNDILNTKDQISNYFRLSDPPYTFKSDLHVYQKQALAWMLHREGRKDANELYNESYVQERMLNELFEEVELPDGSKMYFNGFNGELSVDFPRSKACKGGILADEMGLGKTVMTIALLHAHRRNVAEMQAHELEESPDDIFTLKSRSKNKKEVAKEKVKEKEREPERTNGGSGSEDDSFDPFGLAEIRRNKEQKSKMKAIISKSKPVKDDPVNFKKNKKIKKNDDNDDFDFSSKNKKIRKKEALSDDFSPIRKENGLTRKDSFDFMGFGEEESNIAGTLIVVPLTVISQWENELAAHSRRGSLSVLQYYGTNRKKTRLSDYDVVLTTYGLLESEYSKQKDKEPSGIFRYEWFRVILDEAHYIKGRSTKTARAAFDLNVEFRWCLTGTPIQNKLDDLFSLLHFLRLETWGDYFWWNSYVNNYRSKEEASTLVRGILKSILIRRTKKSTYLDGRNILELPKKLIRTHLVKLTKEERKVYECFYRGSAGHFHDIVDGGRLQYEYAHIFELFIRLRQVCDHPALVFTKEDLKDQVSLESAVLKFLEKKIQNLNPKKEIKPQLMNDDGMNDESKTDLEGNKGKPGSQFINNIIENLKSKELEPCSICLEEILEPMITNCGHIFCKNCINVSIDKYHKCPLCKQTITSKDVMSIAPEETDVLSQNLIDMNSADFKMSSKLEAIINAVSEAAKKEEKCVIFSQFNGMLSLIERFLDNQGFPHRRIDGSKTLKQRIQYIEDFKKDPSVVVFLISLKAGGVGLNLTMANHVFVVDPWWNPAVEDQAIERVHRIGQQKEVNVIRFICSKTIEERILELQDTKKDLINMTLHFNPEQQKKQNMANMMHVMKGFDD